MDNKSIRIVHIESNAQNLESWIAMHDNNKVVGHIFMSIESYEKIKFLDAWVDENFRRRGIFRMLWDARWEYVKKNYYNYTVYAWCKSNSLPLLLEKGFEPGEVVTYVEKKIS